MLIQIQIGLVPNTNASTAASQPLTQISNTGSDDRFDFRVRKGTGSRPIAMAGLAFLLPSPNLILLC